MNKTATFIIGFILGAAGGSSITYLLVKDKCERDEDARLADMEEYYEEREQRRAQVIANDFIKKKKSKSEKTPDEETGQNSEDFRDDEKITNNKGVKKYHHDNGLESAYGSARIFGNDAKPKKEKESKMINEVTEEEFMNAENGYQKQTIDVFMSNDDDEPEIVGIWAYETDNETPVDKKFGKPIEQLLNGRSYDELLSYCGEDTIGQLYLKNDELMTDFEFVIHND